MTDEQPNLSAGEIATAGRRRIFGQWLVISAFWLLIATASVMAAWLFRLMEIGDAVRFASWQWLPWIVLSPVILWLASAFTIERSTWLRSLGAHLAACVILMGGLGALEYYGGPRLGGPPPYLRGNSLRGEMPHEGPAPMDGGHGDSWPFSPGGDHGPPPGMDGTRFRGQGWGADGPPRRGPPSVAWMILARSAFQVPIFWAMVGVAHALLFHQRAKDRERRGLELKAQLTQARLQALRMQLNPHFLFNTLNSIASLVYDQPRVADEMIGSLSDLLRLTLTAPDRQEVSLREELDFLDQYLFIEETRFGERLRVERDIEPETLNATTPILILQPLVENAIKHGIETQLAPGIIRIAARHAGDLLRLEVKDNGRGLANAPDGRAKEGVGLGNTRARLLELYGGRGSLEYGAPAGGGFSVVIQIPWRTPATPDGAKGPGTAS